MPSSFAQYQDCRQGFRQLANELGAERQAWTIDDGDLTIDAAVFGEATATKLIVLSSGLHGVEGYFGSAVQQQWMRQAKDCALGSTRVLLLHALNPFGFAHCRRANEENVDLNRAFFATEQRGETDSLYARLDPLLNPLKPSPFDNLFDSAVFTLRALGVLARHGGQRVSQAIAAGQHAFPRGLFFGGQGTTKLQQILETHLPKLFAGADSIEHFDLHTGLGSYGQFRLLMQPGLAPQDIEDAMDRYGSVVVPPSSSVGYTAEGTLGGWLQQQHKNLRYYCVEVGTYSALKVLSALRRENRAWFSAGPDSPAHRREAERMRECFYPSDPSWRKAAIQQSLSVLETAIAGRVTELN